MRQRMFRPDSGRIPFLPSKFIRIVTASNSPSHRHDVTNLAEQITHKAGKKNEEVVVLGVMVGGGPYAEDVEARTRYRYAALSALGELDYVPDDSEHIGYLEDLAFNVNSGDSWLPPFSMYKLVELVESERPSACVAMTFDHNSYYSGHDDPWFVDLVPYEWFKKVSLKSKETVRKHVLVLWLNDNSFGGSPLRKLSEFNGSDKRKNKDKGGGNRK